jgi:hypothetical protein
MPKVVPLAKAIFQIQFDRGIRAGAPAADFG